MVEMYNTASTLNVRENSNVPIHIVFLIEDYVMAGMTVLMGRMKECVIIIPVLACYTAQIIHSVYSSQMSAIINRTVLQEMMRLGVDYFHVKQHVSAIIMLLPFTNLNTNASLSRIACKMEMKCYHP